MTIYVYCDANINWSINCQHQYFYLKILRLNNVGIILLRAIVLHWELLIFLL